MKIQKGILITFLAALFIPLTCAGGFADMNLDGYTLRGDVELGGRFFAYAPSHRDRGYFEEYIPYNTGILLNQLHLSLTNKDGDQYFRFFMSRPGERDQDFLLQVGKIGLYSIELEYDQLQHVYSTVNPIADQIMILVQRLRFSGDYTPTPDIDLYADYNFLQRTGEFPASYIGHGPNSGGYAFNSVLKPVDNTQHDVNLGAEYYQPMYQFHVGYYLSLFEDDLENFQAVPSASNSYVSLPPSNIAQYVNGTGAVNLPCANTRITGTFSYGWLTQDDTVLTREGDNLYPAGSSLAGSPIGSSNLSARTIAGDISGVSRPTDKFTMRYSYRGYDFQNDNLLNPVLQRAFGSGSPLLNMEQYSYYRQSVNLGASYKFNNKAAADLGYTYQEVTRDFQNGDTTNNTPKVALVLYPYDWLNLITSYAYSDRTGSNFLEMSSSSALTYKFYSGDDKRHTVNFIAELLLLNNLTFSANFGLYDDSFNNSGYGLLSDNGWSAGADVSWAPFKFLALTVGYDHEESRIKELANNVSPPRPSPVTGDGASNPVLLTDNAYDTVTASANVVFIPDKLKMTTSGSYSYSTSDFHRGDIPNLNESFAHVETFLKYIFDQHWACKVGYIFEQFDMTDSYQRLYTTSLLVSGSPVNQSLNTLDGFYTDYTAHVIEAFLQYKF